MLVWTEQGTESRRANGNTHAKENDRYELPNTYTTRQLIEKGHLKEISDDEISGEDKSPPQKTERRKKIDQMKKWSEAKKDVGIKSYAPEMGQSKPDTKLEARLSPYGFAGGYRVTTPKNHEILKGRGIKKEDDSTIGDKYVYQVTKKAFDELSKKYSIGMENNLD